MNADASQRNRDESIAAEVLRLVERDARIPLQQIQVRVRDAWVTVSGTVETLVQRDAIADCLSDLTGVQGVVNQVDVLPPTDTMTVRGVIADCLHRQADIDAANIGIRVSNGVVTLICDVEHMDQIAVAREAVRQLEGVADVVVQFTPAGAEPVVSGP